MTFSIVIPTYNGEKFVEEALLSVVRQTRPADEIIVSDDNSTDSTLSICEKYKDRVDVYMNAKGPSGFVKGWNNAIDKASGDYIVLLHQDDLLEESFLEEMEKVIVNSPDVLHFFSICNYIDGANNLLGLSHPVKKEEVFYSGLEYVKAYQTTGNPHIHRMPGVITHRSLFEKIKYNPEAGHIADDDFFYRVSRYTDVVGLLVPLASYRLHGESETGALGDDDLVKRLSRDYIFQVKQWKNDSYLDEESFAFFVDHARKYIRRRMGYALKKIDIAEVFQTLSLYRELNKVLR